MWCGMLVQWAGFGTCHQEVAGFTPGLDVTGQVVHTFLPLSPSRITWYQSVSSDSVQFGRSGFEPIVRYKL